MVETWCKLGIRAYARSYSLSNVSFTFTFLSLIVLTFRQATRQPANQPGREVNVRLGAIIYVALLLLSSFPAGVAGSQCACPTISAYNPDCSVVSTEGGGGKREHAQSHHPVIPPLSRSPFVPSFRHLLSPTFLPFLSLPFAPDVGQE